jgi:LysR family transcriptional regulator, mexEF-oprN operon transcriptional activator
MMTTRSASGKLIFMKNTFSEIELRKLDLNLLLVFSALMRERSVSRAATRLFIGPSAISMALARLREAVGDDLLVRAGRAMEPTPRAMALWAQIEPALGSIEDAIRGVRRFDPAKAEMTIRFGAPDDLEFVLIPMLLERLEIDAPGIRLVARPSDFRTLLGRLDDGDADLALSATPAVGIERRHRVQPLHRDGFSTLYDRGQLKRRGALDLDTFINTPQLLLSIVGDLHGPIDDWLAEMGRSRTVVAALSQFPTMPFILKRRRTLTNMPSIAAKYYAKTYDLELSPLPLPSPDFEVSLLWHVRTDSDPAQVWFREVVAQLVATLRKKARMSTVDRRLRGEV